MAAIISSRKGITDMSQAIAKYFSDDQEVKNIHVIKNDDFSARFPGVKGVKNDGYSKFVAHPLEGPYAVLPVTRIIIFKKNPSLHKCDARCQNAKGRNCECSCGGKFHGAGYGAE